MSGVLNLPQTLRGAPRKRRKLASWEAYLKLYRVAPHKLGKLLSGEVCLKLYVWAPRKRRKLASWEAYLKLYVGLRANSGTSRAHLHTATGAAFPAPGRAPINRQSPQRASSRLERGALWRSLAQPCARKPRNVSV